MPDVMRTCGCFRWTLGVAMLAVVVAARTDAAPTAPRSADRVAFATYAEGTDQARKARVLVSSIRAFAGPWRQARVIIAADAEATAELARAKGPGETCLSLEVPPVARTIPFASKAYAASQVEGVVERDVDTLVWLDPESVLLGPPVGFVLAQGESVALQPVFLLNNVGVPAGSEFPSYWTRVLEEVGVEPRAVPEVRAGVDDTRIRFYINCGAIAYRPSRGIGRAWARAMTALLGDRAFRGLATADAPHAIFLHQVVLSAVLCARTGTTERRWIPMTHGYPMNLAERVPASKRVGRLNDVVCLLYDTVWDRDPDWLSRIPVDEPLRRWLVEAYRSLRQPI
jgi:hypothetical protein